MNTKTQPRDSDGQFGSKTTVIDDAEKFTREALDKAGITKPDDEEPWYGHGSTYGRSRGKKRKGKKMSRRQVSQSAVFWLAVIVVALMVVH